VLRGLPAGRFLISLVPVTGRMHQLRLQAAARGLPVLGDDLYGGLDGGVDAEWSARVAIAADIWRDPAVAGTPAIARHAARIDYADPDGGGAVVVEAPLPDYWGDLTAVTTA
jgi:23S rRNA-/tRNA-specific pseudouridylate synthase